MKKININSENQDSEFFNPGSDFFENLEKNILDKIDGKSFILSNDIESPFQVPDNYFNELEVNILNEISYQQFKLKEGIKHPFAAPDDYFDILETQVLAKTKTVTNPFILIWRNNKTAFRYAATLLISGIIGLGVYFNQIKKQDSPTQLAFQELATDDILSYLETQEISANEIESYLSDSDLQEMNGYIPDESELSEEDLLNLIEYQYTEKAI